MAFISIALFFSISTYNYLYYSWQYLYISYTYIMSSYDDYADEFDPYSDHDFTRMDSPESEWSQLETPAGDEADEAVDVATEGNSMAPGVDLAKSRGASP